MDKKFWLEIRENKFLPPEGESVPVLTEELFSYIGSTDPELRDTIAYETFANWLEQSLYTSDQLRVYILRLIVNLQEGLGERDSDTVFLRAFSALFLAEIVYCENKNPFMDKDELHSILARGLEYLESEQDPRGFVAAKGWAHALAHTADLLYVLAQSPLLGRDHLKTILDAIREKLTRPTDWVYIHGEDDRLVRAVMAILDRKLIDDATVRAWLVSFSTPADETWKDSFKDDLLQRAYFNSRTFLRSLFVKMSQAPDQDQYESPLADIQHALQALKQF